MNIQDMQNLPMLSEEEIAIAYEKAQASLHLLHQLDLDTFRAADRGLQEKLSSIENQFWNIAENLAWGMRVADSFGNSELIETVRNAVRRNASFEYFLAYVFLSCVFQREAVLENEGYRLNSLTEEMREYLVAVLVRRLASTCSSIDLFWMSNLMNRIICWLPLSPTPESYFGIYDVGPIIAVLEGRGWEKELNETEGRGAMRDIRRCWYRIEEYRRKMGGLAELH
jgi:hypothetical protein